MYTLNLGKGKCPICSASVDMKESKRGFATCYCHSCRSQTFARGDGAADHQMKASVIKAPISTIPPEIMETAKPDGGLLAWMTTDD